MKLNEVSVPLRGLVFRTFPYSVANVMSMEYRFRPLTGLSISNWYTTREETAMTACGFRPLTGLSISNSNRVYCDRHAS